MLQDARSSWLDTVDCDVQVAFNAFVTGTLFFRTRLHRNTIDDADLYLAALFFTLVAMLFNNWAEFAIISERLSLFYKQVGLVRCRDQIALRYGTCAALYTN